MMRMRSPRAFPPGYSWLIEKEIVGFEPFTRLEPWFFLRQKDCFWTNGRWPDACERNIWVFAKRQDNDDLAGFLCAEDGTAEKVAVIHGWTDNGFDMLKEFPSIWEWLKSAVDDIGECVDSVND